METVLRFCVAGVPGVLLYWISYISLTRWLKIGYIEATVIASIINWSSNFIFQKFWTFQNKKKKGTMLQVVYYTSMVLLFIFILSPVQIYLMVDKLGIWDIWAQWIAMAITSALSYLTSRRIFAK